MVHAQVRALFLFTHALYDAEVRGMDNHIRELLAERDVADSALMVITSDHGDESPRVFSELGTIKAARRGQHKLIHPENLSLNAFDLLVDAPESRPILVSGNLDGDDPTWATELQTALFQHRGEEHTGGALPEPEPMDRLSNDDRRALEHLRMLGYVK